MSLNFFIAVVTKATYHRPMSDKHPDERNIDEILASIDEMLSQKEPYEPKGDSRKDKVKEAAQVSQEKLGLLSTADEEKFDELGEIELEEIDIDEFIGMGIDTTEPYAVEKELDSADRLVEKERLETSDSSVRPENIDHKEPINEVGDASPIPIPESIPELDEADSDTSLLGDDFIHEAEIDALTAEVDGNEEGTPRRRILLTEELLEPSAQEALPLWIEKESSNDKSDVEEPVLEKTMLEKPSEDRTKEHKKIEPEVVDTHQMDEEKVEEASQENSSEYQTDFENELEDEQPNQTEMDAASELLSDIENDLESVPMPSIESQITPIQDVTPEHEENIDEATDANLADDEHFDQVFKAIANDETITFDVEEDIGMDTVYKIEPLDDNTELVEVMMADVLGEETQAIDEGKTLEESETKEGNLSLGDAAIKALVQLVSDDVSEQMQYHMQTLLPALVQSSLQKHLKTLKDNNK